MEDSHAGLGLAGWGWNMPAADSIVVFHVPPGSASGVRVLETVFETINGIRWATDGTIELIVGETIHTSAFYRLDPRTRSLRRVATIPLNDITPRLFPSTDFA